MVVDTIMRIRVDGSKRPICRDCTHSVMSHGEKDGKLFCWSCLAMEKECKLTDIEQNSMCVK